MSLTILENIDIDKEKPLEFLLEDIYQVTDKLIDNQNELISLMQTNTNNILENQNKILENIDKLEEENNLIKENLDKIIILYNFINGISPVIIDNNYTEEEIAKIKEKFEFLIDIVG